MKIKGPCWQCKWCDIEFQVHILIVSYLLEIDHPLNTPYITGVRSVSVLLCIIYKHAKLYYLLKYAIGDIETRVGVHFTCPHSLGRLYIAVIWCCTCLPDLEPICDVTIKELHVCAMCIHVLSSNECASSECWCWWLIATVWEAH